MKKIIAFVLLLVMVVSVFAGCGEAKSEDKVIRVWVGEESVEFYQTLCDEYVAAHSDFGYTVVVKGMDTGSVAGTITNDPQAAALVANKLAQQIGDTAVRVMNVEAVNVISDANSTANGNAIEVSVMEA